MTPLRFLDRVPPPARPWVFAVEPDAIQVTWTARTFRGGAVRFRIADTSAEVETEPGLPGAVTLDGLPPATTLTLRIDAPGIPARWRTERVTTLAPPPGDELYRFGTLSDLHIGTQRFGFFGTMVETPTPEVAHPIRAGRAALDELAAWGARLVVVKGDITNRGRAHEWEAAGKLWSASRVPVRSIPGNHEHYGNRSAPNPYTALAHLGHDLTEDVDVIDVPGLRIVLVDSTWPRYRRGRIRHVEHEVLDALATAPTPALIAMHHFGQLLPLPTFLPPGISSREMNPFLQRVADVAPATFITSGHTHRHRRRQVGPVVLTEVGSAKDYPGTWAGYAVHEGGIRQVVRRVSPPDLLRWTDYTAGAAFGAWGTWSPGLRDHRCFSHAWPR